MNACCGERRHPAGGLTAGLTTALHDQGNPRQGPDREPQPVITVQLDGDIFTDDLSAAGHSPTERGSQLDPERPSPRRIGGADLSPRRFVVEHLAPRLQFADAERDLVVIRVEAWGRKGGQPRRATYERGIAQHFERRAGQGQRPPFIVLCAVQGCALSLKAHAFSFACFPKGPPLASRKDKAPPFRRVSPAFRSSFVQAG